MKKNRIKIIGLLTCLSFISATLPENNEIIRELLAELRIKRDYIKRFEPTLKNSSEEIIKKLEPNLKRMQKRINAIEQELRALGYTGAF